jgi:membrane protease YdiL (CAAX protease family)
VLVRRYGRAYGVLTTSLTFGVVHVGVYHAALYQTALLGAAFAIAWLEGGLVAAFLAHATWSALALLTS